MILQKHLTRYPNVRLGKRWKLEDSEVIYFRWIGLELNDRRQRQGIHAYIIRKLSEWIKVISGVPYGSVLVLLLFVILFTSIDNEIISTLKNLRTILNYSRMWLRRMMRAVVAALAKSLSGEYKNNSCRRSDHSLELRLQIGTETIIALMYCTWILKSGNVFPVEDHYQTFQR